MLTIRYNVQFNGQATLHPRSVGRVICFVGGRFRSEDVFAFLIQRKGLLDIAQVSSNRELLSGNNNIHMIRSEGDG